MKTTPSIPLHEELARNPIYLAGLHQPLESISKLLRIQGKPEHALAIDVAIIVIENHLATNFPQK